MKTPELKPIIVDLEKAMKWTKDRMEKKTKAMNEEDNIAKLEKMKEDVLQLRNFNYHLNASLKHAKYALGAMEKL